MPNYRKSVGELFQNRAVSTLVFVFITAMLIKYTLFLAAQCFYVHLIQKQYHNREEDVATQLQAEIIWIQRLMIDAGSIYRKTGITGIIIYSILVSSTFMFLALKLIFEGQFFRDHYDRGWLSFIANPRKEAARLSAEIDNALDLIIISNLNSVLISSILNNVNPYYFEDKEKVVLDEQTNGREYDYTRLHTLTEQVYLNLNASSDEYKRLFCPSKNNVYNQKLAVVGQLDHLIGLFYDKTPIWPINRSQTWSKTSKSIFIKLLIGLKVLMNCFGSIIVLVTVNLAKVALQNNSSELDSGHYNQIDRLTIVCILITASLLLDYFSDLPVILVVSIIDQMEQLKYLNKQLGELNVKLNRYLLVKTSDIEFRKQLARECDVRAINLYIGCQLYKKDITFGLKLTEFIIYLEVMFAALTLSPIVIYFKNLPSEHIPFLLSLWIALLILINTPFVLCAELHVGCLKIMKKVWSIIANSKTYLIQNVDDDGEPTTSETIKKSLKMSFYAESEDACPITAHTILLWQRLVRNKEQFLNFQVKLLRIMELDYSGILKINFWVISLVLISLTYASR